MCRRPSSGRSEAELSRTGADEVYKLLNRLRRHRGIHKQHSSRADSEGHRLEILVGIVRNLVEQRRIHHMGAERDENGISIRRCARYLAGCDVPAGSWYVLYIKLLSQPLAQLLSSKPSEQVRRAARRERHYHAHGPCRISLCPRVARHGRQRGSASDQMQKNSPGKFHVGPLAAFHSITSSTRSRK